MYIPSHASNHPEKCEPSTTLAAIHVFRPDFRKKYDFKTPYEASKSSKNKIRKSMVKCRNDVKSVCF